MGLQVWEVREVWDKKTIKQYIITMKTFKNMLKQWWSALLQSIFEHNKVLDRCRFDGKLTPKQEIAIGVRRFFKENYELRYNVIKQIEEFREKATHGNEKATHGAEWATHKNEKATHRGRKQTKENAITSGKDIEPDGWRPLTDRDLHRIAIEQMEQVGVAWCIDVEQYVHSTFVTDYNPVSDYLDRCGTWDGRDHIGDLARRVPCRCAEWEGWFHRWFLAMVAQWQNLSRDFGNSIVPILIGAQGTHKSTFCKLLLPRELREYYIDDIKLDSTEQVERMLGRMLLVNIDEYNAKTDREQAKIKRLLTEKDVQTRRMRSDQYVMLPRMASFIATTNDPQPLSDPTGSRRYLCCEVTGMIDTSTPIDHRQLYAQAVSELREGAVWYFTKEEEALISQHNQMFRSLPSAETVLTSYYTPGPRCKEYFVKTIDVQQVLRSKLSSVDVPSIKKLTLALRSCGFQFGAINGQRGWYAKRLDDGLKNNEE